MSETTKTPDITLIGIANGSFPASDAEARALAAEVLRLRAERDALRGIVVRLAGDDGMYSDDYGPRCLCGFKRDHDYGCLRAEAQALLGGDRAKTPGK
jgi:hypothetical protein